MSESTEPKPVIPAVVAPEPATALDSLAETTEPTGLGKILAQAETYLTQATHTAEGLADQAYEAAKPYTDAVTHRVEEIVHELQGQAADASTTASQTTTQLQTDLAATTEKAATEGQANVSSVVENVQGMAGGVVENVQGMAGGVVEKGKGLLSDLSATIQQVTTKIDQQTATPDHPGLITQIVHAKDMVMEKVGPVLEEAAGGTGTKTVPATDDPTIPAVTTTTNAVPHTV